MLRRPANVSVGMREAFRKRTRLVKAELNGLATVGGSADRIQSLEGFIVGSVSRPYSDRPTYTVVIDAAARTVLVFV